MKRANPKTIIKCLKSNSQKTLIIVSVACCVNIRCALCLDRNAFAGRHLFSPVRREDLWAVTKSISWHDAVAIRHASDAFMMEFGMGF